MRKTTWLFLLCLGSGAVTLTAALAVWVSLNHRPPEPLILPAHADARTYGSLALELAAQSRFADALTTNTRALSYSPDQASLLYNQAWLEARLGRWGQALNTLEKARRQVPNDPEMAYLRVWLLQQLGRQNEARTELVQARQFAAQPADPYVKARLFQLENKHADALKAFNQALQKNPQQAPGFYYWRSRSQRALGQNQAALADLDRAVSAEPTARLYRERAVLKEQLGQLPGALSDLNQVIQLEPSKEARLAYARLQLEIDPALGKTEVEALLKQEPKWIAAQLLHVRSQIEARQLKPAQQALAEIQQREPDNAEAWWLQGVILRNQRKYPQALSALNQAQKLGYNPTQVELERARLAAQQGNKPDANTRVLKLLKQSPELKSKLENDRLLKKFLKPSAS